jgi:hypothetical protein
MARVSVFVEAGNAHRTVPIGGSKENNMGYARLICDHAHGTSEARIKCSISGNGTNAKERKKLGDQRQAHFQIILPKPSEGVTVEICTEDPTMANLVRFGAALCQMKAVDQAAKGDTKAAEITLNTIAGNLKEMEEKTTTVPNVMLPGGVTLKHALACVQLVSKLTQQGSQN